MHRSFYAPHVAHGPVPWYPEAPAHPARRLAARLLRRAGAWLAWIARQLAAGRRAEAAPPEVEFYAEAGAPEGSLFIDGEYVGRIDVKRL
ncbi:MAG TPA: hypothetical protein VGQ91_12425 [Ideonella sp.]|jgi:hypothetical protein|nr:hypothetical protein [Ideonella sp.]